MDYKKSAARKYLVGIHSTGFIVNPKTNKSTVKRMRAKPNCRRCHGRGFEGWYNEGGGQIKVWICACFIRKVAAYADNQGIQLKDIDIELRVDEEENENKIKVVGGFNATGILGDTGRVTGV